MIGVYYYKTAYSPSDMLNILAVKNLTIRNTTIKVEIADTLTSRKQGLSGRTSLGDGRGMLFVYDTPGFYSFWMKDMSFPIDIIWIDESKQIIGITENVSPDTFPETFRPSNPARSVLEVSAGWSDRNFIKTGDLVIF